MKIKNWENFKESILNEDKIEKNYIINYKPLHIILLNI